MLQLKTGDVVQLKSGGPKMTVQTVSTSGLDRIKCQWFAGSKLEDGYFPIESLILVKESGKKKSDEDDA